MTYKETLRMIKTAGGFNPGLLPQAFTDINLGLEMQNALRPSTNTSQGYNDSSWLFSLVPGLIAGGMSLFGGSGKKQQPTSTPTATTQTPQGQPVKPVLSDKQQNEVREAAADSNKAVQMMRGSIPKNQNKDYYQSEIQKYRQIRDNYNNWFW